MKANDLSSALAVVPYLGRDVVIRWRDPEHDWHWFRVLAVGVYEDGKPYVELVGRTSPDGASWIGDAFRTSLGDIKRIKGGRR